MGGRAGKESSGIVSAPRWIKVGQAVRALFAVFGTGVSVGAGMEGVIVEVAQGRRRARVAWINGATGWHYTEILEPAR
jgi:hypothetical protein